MARSFNPFDAEQAHDAWPLLAELREESAVVDIGDGMAYVTRHAECRQLLRDTDGFSSAQGFKAPGVFVPIEDRTLGELDPPNHTVVRRVMVTALTPKSVKAAEPYIAAAAKRLLAALPDDGGFLPQLGEQRPGVVRLFRVEGIERPRQPSASCRS